MVKVDDWSDLIVINFPGGQGGDFFSNLINLNFNKNTSFEKDNFHRYVYNESPFGSDLRVFTTPSNLLLFYLDNYKHVKYFDIKLLNNYYYQEKFKDEDFIDKSRKFFNKPNWLLRKDPLIKFFNVYYDQPENINNSLNQFFYDLHSHNFKNNIFRLVNCHILNINNVYNLQTIFPKSHNINFYTKNVDWFFITKNILLPWKIYPSTLQELFVLPNLIDVVKSNNNYDYNVSDNAIGLHVDPFELIIEGKNYDSILSEFLNKTIVLDKQRLQLYREQIIEILNKFNINVHKHYSSDTLMQKGLSIINDNI